AADPNDPNVMFAGGDDGGVWKTSDWLDPSPRWVPLTDNQPSLRVDGYRSLVLAPSDHNVIYAAVSGPGSGILKSSDGGTTWPWPPPTPRPSTPRSSTSRWGARPGGSPIATGRPMAVLPGRR